ncbi:glycosyltransferase family 2 protein [Pseudovibrio exalbescens]|uniref:Glycosyltransferase 2-like domain-containing protein n=1 Tax=Pseudovibrio exalbescens TaxID=197461 RepID=A0A1U7JJA7_9HYPH|nr:glycosyltransferase [Pseudovibrio exalbescens]OKL44774.1 hypothetical protein A3843_06755 [Pseudovibrio exalbescens]
MPPLKGHNIVAENLTVVVKTFERPDMVTRCINSLREYYPTTRAIVADDSFEPTEFLSDPYTNTLKLPPDTGISEGRNKAIELVETPYYLLIDDDHCFERDANLSGLVELISATTFDIIAMRMLDYRPIKNYCRGELHYAGTFEKEDGVLYHYIDQNRGYLEGYPLYDIVLNCYIARTSTAGTLKFDETIKIGKEHGDYFLRAKDAGLKVTISKQSFIHHRPVYSQHYTGFRKRSQSFEAYYLRKHGIIEEITVGKPYNFFNKLKYYPQRLKYITKILAR